MDRVKKRKFDSMWHTYSESFQDWYGRAPRHERAKVVNEGIAREDGQLSVNIMQQWALKENVMTGKTNSSGWRSQGVIYEEACQRCGGEDKLRAALARRAVIIHREGGMEFYTFPSSISEAKEHIDQSIVSTAHTPITQDMHDEIKAGLLDLWNITSNNLPYLTVVVHHVLTLVKHYLVPGNMERPLHT